MKTKGKPVRFLDVLNRERLGLIHRLFVRQMEKSDPAWLGLGHKVEEHMPELKRIANVFTSDVGLIVQAPSQRNFRKGLRPGEEKPLPMEKLFAALVLATRGRREPFQAVVRLWHFLVFATQAKTLPKEKLQSLTVDFLLARRGKVLREWLREQRFKKLVQKFQSGYIESLLRLMEHAVFRAPDRPLLEVSREIYRIGGIISTMEKSAQKLVNIQVVERLDRLHKTFGRKEREAFDLALVYAFEPYSAPLTKKSFKDLCKDIVTESFLLQRNTVKAITAERSGAKRAAAAASLDPLMRVLQIVVMNSLGMIDHEAYAGKVIADVEEELRKRMLKKFKRKK